MSCEDPNNETEVLMPRRPKYDKSKTCVKCKQKEGKLVIRHAAYCKECFSPLMIFRFRKALEPHINANPDGPRRTALRPTGNLLIAYSGGLGSTVLLDMVNRCYVTPDESFVPVEGGRDHPRHERVWKKVFVCYAEICEAVPGMKSRVDEVKEVVSRYPGVELLILHIQDAFDPSWWSKVGASPSASLASVNLIDDRLPFTFTSTQNSSTEPTAALRHYLASLPTPSAFPVTIKTLIRVLLQHTAIITESSHLLYGTSLTSLAVSLITGVSHGGGFHVKEEAQEEWSPDTRLHADTQNTREGKSTRSRSVRLIRPLRDIGRKECAAWSWWMDLKVVGRDERIRPGAKPGIEQLTTDFIVGLEKDFPSTVSTIVKTCAKLAPKGDTVGNCFICQRPIQHGVQSWKDRIAIRSRDAPSPTECPLSETGFLTPHLCYVCHTNVTSKSTRPAPSLYSDVRGDGDAVPLTVWTSYLLDGLDSTDERDSGSGGTLTVGGMTEQAMHEVVKDYLLDNEDV